MLKWLRHRLRSPLTTAESARPVRTGSVVDCAIYARGTRRPDPPDLHAAARAIRFRRDAFVWLGLFEPDESTMRAVAEAYGLHDLIVDQTTEGGHRPVVETIGDEVRIVLRTAAYVQHEELTETSEVVDTGDVTILIGKRFAITVRHGAPGALAHVREDLEKRAAMLGAGPWAVAYAVCDAMVDSYLEVATHVEDDLERLEATAFGGANRAPGIAQMYQLKRELVEFKRAVLPLQEPLHRLLQSEILPDELRPYFVDIRNNLTRAVDRVSGFDDLLNSILQARLAQVSVDQNNDMRKIASWAALAAVQTAIAGLYGMNFADMPLLDTPYGYYVVLAVMVLAGLVLYRRFKRVGWL